MRSFDDILAIAAERKGGAQAVLADIDLPKSPDELATIPDDRWLSMFSRGIMSAGISWKMVENKWPEIEEAFHGFDVGRVSMMSDEWFDDLMSDRRIIRSAQKVQAVAHNAAFIREVAETHGNFGRVVGDWPNSDFIGLLAWLKAEGSRLGGATGAYALRRRGRDGFILSRDVVGRRIAEGVIDRAPTSIKAKAAVQAAFDEWAAQSGRSLTEISRVLAQSIDA